MRKTKEKNENLIKIYKSNYLAVKNNNKIKERKNTHEKNKKGKP